jgi:AraC-like DNA-binding protein
MDKEIKKYNFREDVKHGIEIVDLHYVTSQKPEMMIVPHRAQFYHVLYIEKGEGVHYVDFNPIQIKNQMLLFVPYNSVNVFDKNCVYRGRGIIFTDTFFSKDEQDFNYLHSSLLFSNLYPVAVIDVADNNEELRRLIQLMEDEYQKESDFAQYEILHNMLHVFLLKAERQLRAQGTSAMKPSVHLDYLLQFKAILETNFKAEKSVKSYASALAISEKQLQTATKSLVDKTPKQVIDERVVLEAKRLLVHSSQAVKEIAYELGYDEPTNFIKYFRKHVKCTPAEFRDRY